MTGFNLKLVQDFFFHVLILCHSVWNTDKSQKDTLPIPFWLLFTYWVSATYNFQLCPLKKRGRWVSCRMLVHYQRLKEKAYCPYFETWPFVRESTVVWFSLPLSHCAVAAIAPLHIPTLLLISPHSQPRRQSYENTVRLDWQYVTITSYVVNWETGNQVLLSICDKIIYCDV
jgi:hypothetical protein